MNVVLDLDLDFFVHPTASCRPDSAKRLSSREYTVATGAEVKEFLEEHCHLATDAPVPGREVTHHVDAFWTWKEWLERGALIAPFNVVHVDAHSDLGIGETGWKYLMSDLLSRDLRERSTPRLGSNGLSSGSFLAFAIANRWVASLTHVYPAKAHITPDSDGVTAPGDSVRFFMRDFDFRTNLIELRHYAAEDALDAIMKDEPPPSTHVEPAISFTWQSGTDFSRDNFTHMIVAQSPAFTPKSADALLAVIRRYFSPM